MGRVWFVALLRLRSALAAVLAAGLLKMQAVSREMGRNRVELLPACGIGDGSAPSADQTQKRKSAAELTGLRASSAVRTAFVARWLAERMRMTAGLTSGVASTLIATDCRMSGVARASDPAVVLPGSALSATAIAAARLRVTTFDGERRRSRGWRKVTMGRRPGIWRDDRRRGDCED